MLANILRHDPDYNTGNLHTGASISSGGPGMRARQGKHSSRLERDVETLAVSEGGKEGKRVVATLRRSHVSPHRINA